MRPLGRAAAVSVHVCVHCVVLLGGRACFRAGAHATVQCFARTHAQRSCVSVFACVRACVRAQCMHALCCCESVRAHERAHARRCSGCVRLASPPALRPRATRVDDLSACDDPPHPAAAAAAAEEEDEEGEEGHALRQERYADLLIAREQELVHPLGVAAGGRSGSGGSPSSSGGSASSSSDDDDDVDDGACRLCTPALAVGGGRSVGVPGCAAPLLSQGVAPHASPSRCRASLLGSPALCAPQVLAPPLAH